MYGWNRKYDSIDYGRHIMIIKTAITTGLIIACTTVLHAQEVYIDSLDGNGQLTVTAPSNSDFTVKWVSSLTPSPDWQSNWMDLKNIHCTNGSTTLDVPMFYRVTCWTNGLFIRLPVGRTFTYAVSNALGEAWTETLTIIAEANFPVMTNDYQLIVVKQDWEGEMPAEATDEVVSGYLRSTDTAMYQLDYLNGNEFLDWQEASTGTIWTVDYGNGDSNTVEVAAIETVHVPAGTFTDCIKFIKHDHNADVVWHEWIKPGFFMVKWIDGVGGSNASPTVYELQSWSD